MLFPEIKKTFKHLAKLTIMIKVNYDGKEHCLDMVQISVGSILQKLKINAEMVLVSKNGELVLEDELVTDKDLIDVLKVVSGG